MDPRLKRWLPVLAALLVSCAYVAWRLAVGGWDPVALAELGTRFSEGDPTGSEGYDGQFVYFIAVDPDPERVADRLDTPAYRYQRILLSLLARWLAFGNVEAIPWAILAINLIAHLTGTWALATFMHERGVSAGYAVVYGLWVGLVISIGLDLNEPLAYALVVLAWLARERKRSLLSAGLFTLAAFSKETTILFWGAALMADVFDRGRRRSFLYLIAGGLLFVSWHFWLWRTFGDFGFGPGGAMTTPFEWIPFMGFFRIGMVDPAVFRVFLVLFGPSVLLPTIWAIGVSGMALVKRIYHAEAWALLFNSIPIVFLPFSTFREPLGLLRFASGLVLAVLLYSTRVRMQRPLRYSFLWLAYLVILVNG